MLPDPKEQVLRGWIFDEVVEVLVVEPVDDPFGHDAFDFIEILDHAARRPFGLDRPGDGDFQTVRVPVHARALSGMKRQNVCRLEAELLAELQFGYRSPCGPMRSKRCLRSARKPLAT